MGAYQDNLATQLKRRTPEKIVLITIVEKQNKNLRK